MDKINEIIIHDGNFGYRLEWLQYTILLCTIGPFMFFIYWIIYKIDSYLHQSENLSDYTDIENYLKKTKHKEKNGN